MKERFEKKGPSEKSIKSLHVGAGAIPEKCVGLESL